MAQLTVQKASRSGLEASYAAAAAGGDSFENGGNTLLHVKNGGGSDMTVTVASQVSNPPPGTTADDAGPVTVTAGEDRFIGPFPMSAFNDGDGLVQVSYSAVTSVTVAAIEL